MYTDPEVVEHVQEILKATRTYIDDVAIHMTSNSPNTMVTLRMQLAKIGLDTVDNVIADGNLAPLRSAMLATPKLKSRFLTLQERYVQLDKQIRGYRFDAIV